MDTTLAQLLNHIYDIEQENALFKDFLAKNAAVLKEANAVVPGLDEESDLVQE